MYKFVYIKAHKEVRKLRLKLLPIACLIIFMSCQTYTVSVESFRNQMVNVTPENLREVKINNPGIYSAYTNIRYLANNIDTIQVVDKNGNEVALENSPKLEMRLTHNNGKRYVLLFDTVTLENDTLKGARSRILHNLRREFPLDSIKFIEIQDSKKKYKYQN